MAKKDHDDVADALARMMSGEHPQDENEGTQHGDSIEPPKAPPDAKTVQRTTKPAANFRSATPARPATTPPRVTRAEAPSKTPTPPPAPPPAPPKARPAAPVRPAAPSSPNLTPPAPPAPVAEETIEGATSESNMDIVDDGDAVIVPAPSKDVFAPKHHETPKKNRAAILKTLEFKRTMIPILLTTGVLFPLFGALKFLRGPDSAFAALPPWVSILLFITGLVLLAFAFLNIMQIKQQLETADTPSK